MSLTVYLVSAVLVLFFSGLLGMAGLGAAFLFVPLFYYLGIPLAQATSAALLLNVVSLVFASINYYRGRLINWRVGIPILVLAVALSPVGALLTARVDKKILLALFCAFLFFAGFMMLFYKARRRAKPLSRTIEVSAGVGVGAVAGFLGGLLGVGGGNFILPVLELDGSGREEGRRDYRARGGLLVLERLPRSRLCRRPQSSVSGHHGRYGGRRFDHWLSGDEDQDVE